MSLDELLEARAGNTPKGALLPALTTPTSAFAVVSTLGAGSWSSAVAVVAIIST
jgi:hypothetical protein